jgi:hypothetical protein
MNERSDEELRWEAVMLADGDVIRAREIVEFVRPRLTATVGTAEKRWTPERVALLQKRRMAGERISKIVPLLNAMPGVQITVRQAASYANGTLGLRSTDQSAKVNAMRERARVARSARWASAA